MTQMQTQVAVNQSLQAARKMKLLSSMSRLFNRQQRKSHQGPQIKSKTLKIWSFWNILINWSLRTNWSMKVCNRQKMHSACSLVTPKKHKSMTRILSSQPCKAQNTSTAACQTFQALIINQTSQAQKQKFMWASKISTTTKSNTRCR